MSHLLGLYLLDNLSIVWEEITRAIEPITYDESGRFNLTKPFSLKNKNEKEYNFLYVDIKNKYTTYPFITCTKSFKTSGCRLLSYYYNNSGNLEIAMLYNLIDGITQSYGCQYLNPVSVIFYGGYIQSN